MVGAFTISLAMSKHSETKTTSLDSALSAAMRLIDTDASGTSHEADGTGCVR
jgi:hypothetical protein